VSDWGVSLDQMHSISPQLRADIDEQNRVATNAILWSVVPIYRFLDGTPQAQGTGTLFQCDGRRFLVTAAHVLEGSRSGESFLTADLPHQSTGIPLEGRLLANGNRAVDVAVLELAEGTARALAGLRFLTLNDVTFEGPSREHYFWFCGFPQSWTIRDDRSLMVEARHFLYATGLYQGATDALQDFAPELHIALDASRGAVTVDPNWQPARVPDGLQGISGCGVWHAVPDAQRPNGWAPKLIAVQTGVYNPKPGVDIVRATAWYVVHDLIRRLLG